MTSEIGPPVKIDKVANAAIPKFVSDEVRQHMKCGILAHGFVDAVCGKCGHEELVAFSCKRRGICASCIGRRMNEVSAHLVDIAIARRSSRPIGG